MTLKGKKKIQKPKDHPILINLREQSSYFS